MRGRKPDVTGLGTRVSAFINNTHPFFHFVFLILFVLVFSMMNVHDALKPSETVVFDLSRAVSVTI